MIIEFQVGNYRSFKDEVTFSMVAAKITSKNKEIDINNTSIIDKNLTLLKSAAIYGANASGKSNLLEAIGFMRAMVRGSSKDTQTGELIDVDNFRLSSETVDKPSFFQMVFILDNKKYRYGFEVTRKRIISEWLYHVPSTREAKLFERDENEISISKVPFKEAKGLEDKTRDNSLFLSVVAQFNGKISKSILKWFKMLRVYTGIYAFQRNYDYTGALLESPKYREAIIKFINNLDLGFDKIEVRNISSPIIPPKDQDELPEEIRHISIKLREVVQDLITLGASDEYKYVEIKTSHPFFNRSGEIDSSVMFDLDIHESEGTKKIISLSGSIIDTLVNGKVLIVDEIDRSLHPIMTQAIIELFNSPETNPRNAQLIFATHDTNLLSNNLFRRDQIWFTEKDSYSATSLYSLVEYKVRNDASFESDYIRGRYGAIPFIGDFL